MRISFCQPGTDAEPWLAALRACLPDAVITQWVDGAAQADYGVAWAPPQRFIDQQTQLKALFNIGAGVDRLLKLRLPTHLTVVRLDDAGMGVQMAEYVCHALIRHFREFEAYEFQARDGVWQQREARSRSDFPVGILGMGVLGTRVAQAIRQFEFPLNGWSRTPRQIDGVRCFTGSAGLAGFLATTRLLVCLLPLTPDTRDMLNRALLSRLLPAGYVINVARGELLVEEDLVALIDSGHLAGATLDVFRTEPLPSGHVFWRHPRIRVTPHSSAQTLEIESMTQIAAKITALERGEPVSGVVGLERGY